MSKFKFTQLLILILLISSTTGLCQDDENEFVLNKATGEINAENSKIIIDALKDGNKQAVADKFKELIMNKDFRKSSTDMTAACEALYIDGKRDICNEIENAKSYRDAAIIFVYRKMQLDGTNLKLDYESTESFIYSKYNSKKSGEKKKEFTNYLLGTKKLFIVFIDASDEYYAANPDENNKKLSNTTISVERLTSFFRQSVKDARKALTSGVFAMSGGGYNKGSLSITVAVLDPRRLKAPANIVLNNKSFKEDVKFKVHEWNAASVQFGLINNKFSSQNFSLTNGNLVVTPDSIQKETWRSNFYALVEFHLPRDIDNFEPIWKTAFKRDYDRMGFGNWLYRVTLKRLGVYGGVKISKDPLSNIYAGFNYAISKEMSVNFGWTWANEIVPQVTNVGDVQSLDDALKYAKRDYSSPKFSWGLSFAPSQIISMFSNGDKAE